MRVTAARVWYAVLGIVSIIVTIAVSGAMAALCHALGYWAYPVSLAAYIGAFALIYVFLLPPGGSRGTAAFAKRLGVEQARFEKGVWPWVMRRGIPFFVCVATVLLGPFFGAVLVRFLGISERRAWRYALVSSMVSVAIWVSVYLGFMDWVTSLLE